MDLVAWANLIPLEVITWLEYIVVGGLALMALYAVWLRWKDRGKGEIEDWLDTETYEARREREAAAKAAAQQEDAAEPPAAAATEPAAPELAPEPAAAEPGDGR